MPPEEQPFQGVDATRLTRVPTLRARKSSRPLKNARSAVWISASASSSRRTGKLVTLAGYHKNVVIRAKKTPPELKPEKF
jgi:hypothetical protein